MPPRSLQSIFHRPPSRLRRTAAGDAVLRSGTLRRWNPVAEYSAGISQEPGARRFVELRHTDSGRLGAGGPELRWAPVQPGLYRWWSFGSRRRSGFQALEPAVDAGRLSLLA